MLHHHDPFIHKLMLGVVIGITLVWSILLGAAVTWVIQTIGWDNALILFVVLALIGGVLVIHQEWRAARNDKQS